MFGGSDETVTIPTIRAALDLGITPIVAALAYGCDRSEEPVGSALTESRGCNLHRARIMRPVRLAVALMLAVSTTVWAQNFGGSPAQWFHVTWDHRGSGPVPTIQGYVQNDSPFRVTNVRLQIDGLDGGGRPVAQAFGWTFGDIARGDRGYFTAPAIPGAAAYQITVSSFDVVSGGGP